MLTLRLARGSRPLVQLRRLLVAAASAGTGFLLLYVLAEAVARPAGSAPRLLWCLVPLALTVQFAVAVARTDPATWTREGLSALGLGPVRLSVVAAVSTAVSCALGSSLALLVFLHLRGDIAGLPFDGAAARALHADRPFPVAAALTLLALVPLAGAPAAALARRPRTARPPQHLLPWGLTLLAAGFAVLLYAGRQAVGALAGWSLTAAGLVLAGPAVVHGAGALIRIARPGAARLLAGRSLQEEAARLGPPLGMLCAVAAAGLSLPVLRDRVGVPLGPLTGPAAVLAALCAAATLAVTAVETRQARGATREAVRELGAPRRVLRAATALRLLALLVCAAPLTWAVARLITLALTH
ncbi:hypothetical protein LG634_34250 [Streptomyces bambusae]|uniref:hypothetical protein n=1 Tax=Streptomyces bambusae TaxID=1550616 RepID=UPI001CFF5FA3|nr:hypothetical protein [Streptomyces bambusae]MCB5169850.1 hypothetical protein [Streptomyces bambusae]